MAYHHKNRPIDVILPAGGRIPEAFAQQVGTPIKALIPFGCKTILGRTIETFRATPRIGRMVVIGDEETLAEGNRYGAEGGLREGTTGIENIFRGLQWLRETAPQPASHVLIAATDLPFLSLEATEAFLDACPASADIAIPVVLASAYQTRFPNSVNVFNTLKEGEVTLGCLFLVEAETLMKARPHLERLFEARKNQWALARILGLPTIARLLSKRLSLVHIETKCRQVLGCTGSAVWGSSPELAYDIDEHDEYLYALRHFASQQGDR